MKKDEENMKSIWDEFTGKYSLQKTLRFELKPVGETAEHIARKGLLAQDEKRAEDYKVVKKIIDRYHKDFIERALTGFSIIRDDAKIELLKEKQKKEKDQEKQKKIMEEIQTEKKRNQLREYADLYGIRDKTDEQEKEYNALKDSLRKQIVEKFKNTEGWGELFAKELIKEHLFKFAENDDEMELIKEFKTFTTYFTGFHENRRNMYTHEDHATAIPYRLVHENIPRFLDNLSIYNKFIDKNATIKKEIVAIEKEILNNQKISEIFSIDFFNITLTQTGIDFYNSVLGGIALEEQKKIKGVNEYINLYNQKQTDKKDRVPRMKPLYKQILSDRESTSFRIDAFENDNEVLETIEKFHQSIAEEKEQGSVKIKVLNDLSKLIQSIDEYDREKIFIKNDLSLTSISQDAMGEWSVVKNAMDYYYEKHVEPIPQKITKKYTETKEKWLKKSNMCLKEVEDALYAYREQTDHMRELKLTEKSRPICDYFKRCEKTFIEPDEKAEKNREVQKDYLQHIEISYSQVKDLLNTPYEVGKKLAQNKSDVAKIKLYLDAVKDFLHFVKPMHPEKIEGEKDENFYSPYNVLYDSLNVITPLYNKVRNYLTKKPYSLEKYKLNFENSTLLNGWDVNKEPDNTSVLLRKGGLYYLAIMDKHNNHVFREIPELKKTEGYYEKIDYKLLPGPNKMLPKVFFAESNKDYFAPSKDIQENYKRETHKKGDSFNLQHCHQLIDFFKESIKKHEDWKKFNFQFSPTKTYEDISGFYREVEAQGYKITYRNVSDSYIGQLVDEGKLYLFQIYNKDFSSYSKGKPNLHTIYWKMLFDQNNLNDVVYKLNGEAEVFYRKKSLTYDDKILKEGHHANTLKGKFKYPIISNKRFAYDKFQFHVPITMNFKVSGITNVNLDLLAFLQKNKNVNIIGIDRGERHLLYLTMIDQKRNIVKQMTLNDIVNTYVKDGKTVEIKTDYHEKLHSKETERAAARKEWGVIENIKELKEGYLSHVIHVIAKLVIEHNAIIVMEDLNFLFKRGRFKVEKQVYQKFEKMLIDKLNYLVFKEKDQDAPGGVLKAYQLAGKFESFEKLGKQSGIIFYMPAALTSKIDPVTGFVDFLKPKYESLEKAKEFYTKFYDIHYNTEKDRFEFSFDYKNFFNNFENGQSEWTVCSSNIPRYRWNKSLNQNKGAQEEVLVTDGLKKLLQEKGIKYNDVQNLKEIIVEKGDTDFFKKLFFLYSTLLSLRHNNGKHGGEERDYILSPVEPFFNSLEATEQQPKDADANGAYHIALKGLWALRQINAAKMDDLKKVKLALSNKEWLQFAQEKSIVQTSEEKRTNSKITKK